MGSRRVLDYRRGSVAAIVLAASALACGCAPADETAVARNDEALGTVVPNVAADPDDPYTCTAREDPALPDWFPSIECTASDGGCTGWGGGGYCDESGCEVGPFNTYCDLPCQSDADCPLPLTGTARPICHPGVHACQLPCGDDVACPVGMACMDTSPWGLSDSNGPIPAPFMCMQSLDIEVVPPS
jgi:hypothetical protein